MAKRIKHANIFKLRSSFGKREGKIGGREGRKA
jgi:hypothetical protein